MKLTTKQLTLCAVLTAMALALSYLENFFPLSLAIPVPGIKLGLANIVTVFALYVLGPAQALLILIGRCLLGAVFAGNMSALIFSLLGGVTAMLVMILVVSMAIPAFATGTGNVSGAIEGTWNAAQGQVKDIVNNVVFPVIDMILAILFFVKIATAYMDYRKHGQFEFTAPAILFACLLFSLTAPSYIWTIL